MQRNQQNRTSAQEKEFTRTRVDTQRIGELSSVIPVPFTLWICIEDVFDKPIQICRKFEGQNVLSAKEAYETLNNTLVERCNNKSDSDSLLMDMRVDFVLGGRSPSCPSHCFQYAYATFPPTSLSMIVSRSGPSRPSFVSNWRSFFELSALLAPFAVVFLLLTRLQLRLYPDQSTSLSAAVNFLATTYLGRSPPPLPCFGTTFMRVFMIVWMFGVSFLLKFTQTTITASRSVPEYTGLLRKKNQLAALLDAGNIKPCLDIFIANGIQKAIFNAPAPPAGFGLGRAWHHCRQIFKADCSAPDKESGVL
ncbi:uncharacterized protein LOC144109680 [Amblyomma americanum]